MAPGKAAPRGCLRPGPLGVPLGRVRTGASVSTSAGPAAIFTARQRAKCSRGGGLHQPPPAHSAAGDPRVREPLPLPDVISSRAKVGFSFPVGFPTHTADRINPRKWLLCEVWVPEMRVTSLEVPWGRVHLQEEGVGTVCHELCSHMIVEKRALSQTAGPATPRAGHVDGSMRSLRLSFHTHQRGQKLPAQAYCESHKR